MRRVVLGLLVASLLLAGAPRAQAKDGLSVSVGGIWLFRITKTAGGFTPEQRVVEVTRRITEVLSRYRAGQVVPIKLRPSGLDIVIFINGILVVTVTPADAEGTRTTLADVAQQWARRFETGLQRALPDPKLHVF